MAELTPITRPEPPLHRAYYLGFLGALFTCFSPFKTLAYAVPLLFTAWMVMTAQHKELGRRLAIFAFVATAGGLFYSIVEPNFLVQNYALAIVTYSAFLPILLVDSRALRSHRLSERLGAAAADMLLFQASFGIVQALYNGIQHGYLSGDNGDSVEGTIAPAMASEHSSANPMFAINVALILLACLAVPGVLSGRRTKTAVLGIIVLVLASVMHVLIFAFVALVLGWWLTRENRRATTVKRGRRGPLAFALFTLFAFAVVGDQLELVERYATDLLDVDTLAIPRTIMLYRVAEELPESAPQQPWIGLGPGQFSSRAALISSGLFLGGPDDPKPIPFLPLAATPLTQDYCFPLLYMLADQQDDQFGSTQQPFFSVLSVYTELGVFALIAIAWWSLRLIGQVRRRVQQCPEQRHAGMLFITSVLFLGALGLQECYWEMPQAIFVGLLLLKVLYANIMHAEPAPASTPM